ncbi:MAG: SMP-30/gluconolactonase/LRE family protein, partial [Rhizomicrobium sp.]
WYSDFHQHRVSSAAPDGSVRVELEIDDRPSGLGWLPDGRLLVVAMLSQRLLRREANGRAVLHADLKGLAKFHANDMLVDSRGNAFIGCFGFDIDAFIEEHGTGSLFAEPGPPKAPIILVTPDGRAKIASPDHKFPNGMALIGSTLVVAECLIPGLTAFDLAADGTLSNRRPWASLSKDPPAIVPDGICSDSEGAIWCANALGREAVRIAEGGKILERVETSQFAYSCALGGADGRDLVIATAPTSNAVLGAKEANGMLEIARVSVPA